MVQTKLVVEITSVSSLKVAIQNAKVVLIQPRFGCSEHWVEITKKEANRLVETLQDQTPRDMEMYSGRFGVFHGRSRELYLG